MNGIIEYLPVRLNEDEIPDVMHQSLEANIVKILEYVSGV